MGRRKSSSVSNMTHYLKFAVCLGVLLLNAADAAGRGRTQKLFGGADHQEHHQEMEAVGSVGGVRQGLERGTKDRAGKLFPLFSIVTFRNEACASNSVLSGGTRRNGTCLSSTECPSRGGTNAGNCAAGFGVCCLFLVTGTSATITQNCTYIQNPGFPSSVSGTDLSYSYTVNKCSNDVCWLRLDFETFVTRGPADTLEGNGGLCQDFLRFTSSSDARLPTICGTNTGQHVYIDMGNQASDTATLAMTLGAIAGTQQWEIKVTQVECTGRSTPPSGCFQYMTGLTGRIETFNYQATASTHLQSQEYAVCIRQENGFCCVEYMVCTGETLGFSLDGGGAPIANPTPRVDNQCNRDFIIIQESGESCNTIARRDRYCGSALNVFKNSMPNIPICDCTAPFMVEIETDATNQGDTNVATGTAAITQSKGLCLEYTQIPCGTGTP